MFKKILITCVIMAATSTVVAANPYVGGSLGVTDLGFFSNGRVQAGSIGKLFGGYGSIYGINNNFYLGGELNLDLAHYPYYRGATFGLGASIIPGVMLTKYTMIYGRIGLETEHYTHPAITALGSQLGLGLQTSLTKSWDIRGEYVRTSTMTSNSQLNLGLVYNFK